LPFAFCLLPFAFCRRARQRITCHILIFNRRSAGVLQVEEFVRAGLDAETDLRQFGQAKQTRTAAFEDAKENFISAQILAPAGRGDRCG